MTTVKEPPNGPKSPSFFRSIVSKLKPPVAPVSSGTQHHTPLKSQTSDRQSRENASRCQFTFADGRQCKTPPMQLCAHHAPKLRRGAKRVSDASALEGLCSDLTTATNINRALAQTFLLMVQGRISRKDAVAFGYLSQLLLQSVSGVRAEYVAANGYRQWEHKLKTSLTPNADDDPEPSPGGDSGPLGGGGKNLEQRRNGVVEPKKAERPLAERIMGKPDYADILSRSLDLLDRKYDFTPEGRSEANKLALELELRYPQRLTTIVVLLLPRGRTRETSSLCPRRLRVGPHRPPGLIRKLAPHHPSRRQSLRRSGLAHLRRAARSIFVAPPSRRHRKTRSRSSAPGCAPHSEFPLPLPISATTAKHDSAGGPDADHHEGHQTDWYAPPSWSKIRPPDPCPSRKEKLQRKLRSISNSAFRRLQHRNSRGF
jgi:hypothetical protein